MKTLVTGAAGYIGSVTTEVLLAAGHEVVALDNLELGHRDAVHQDATFVQADLRDRDAVMRAFAEHRPDAVLHFASYALVGESMERPEAYFSNNLVGACNLFEAMFAHNCLRFVFSSSCTVYGQPDQMPVTESLPRRALNPYGLTKVMIEEMTEWHAQLRGLRAAILRYFNPAGASARFGEDRAHESHLVPLALAVAAGKRPHLTILGTDYPTPDGTCIRDYIHVVDLAEAHVRALEALDNHATLTLNLGTGNGVSVRQIVDAVRGATDRPVPVEEGPRRPGGADAAVVYADPSRAAELLGWRATRTLDEMIASAWAWRQAHPNGYER
ncbi:MAG: UDP-glucose 4-epimerase GalE [Chloroflexota bacterium]|nr:UDP-glucose 4-epimerase GalE [Chloroflexota bacterium]